MRIVIMLSAAICLLAACQNTQQPGAGHSPEDSAAVQPGQPTALSHTDTLQFIHFEGNYDYWYAIFLNAAKDTIHLVTDSVPDDNLKNNLFEVKWFTDTLEEAGDNNSQYAANRMTAFRVIDGAPFVPPVSEQQVIDDIKNLPEVKGNADQVSIAERPAGDKTWYLIETGTREEDHFSRLFMFRVYVYPKYEIRFYDPAGDTDMSLREWRNK
ncbi:hypothetical protein [Chitinophaga barathri]|uniref:Lipoprotein n=1 Tax=Chitinophaga barathri TaxID=1647451 RepID=A0A3N4M835_9BACT|nr:hypothetical protein [Chitinophaga barathri]RPD39508.1 hypothetical protein EG028_20545 [Chitinophaga barathri]